MVVGGGEKRVKKRLEGQQCQQRSGEHQEGATDAPAKERARTP